MIRRCFLCGAVAAFLMAGKEAMALGGVRPSNDPKISQWFKRQRASKPSDHYECCGEADAHRLEPEDWRVTKDGSYEVHVLDQWLPIEPDILVYKPLEDPNPTGKAVLWRGFGGGYGGPILYCFSPWEAMG